MEFFVWCWIWDRRLLCGLKHGRAAIYLWLIPFIISCAMLPYALIRSVQQDQSATQCSSITEVRDNA